jgi:hypothetical protein
MMDTKFITLYGRPNSGKLVAAITMAKRFSAEALNVVIIIANNYEPKTGIIFPTKSKLISDKKSLGELIISPTLSEAEVLQNLVPMSAHNDNVYFLGYKNGDNPFTYAAPAVSHMRQLFDILRGITDVVISIPIALFWTDNLSDYMLRESDLAYYVHELSPQSLSFFQSRKDQLAIFADKERQDVLNKIEKEDIDLIAAYENEIGGTEFKLPYAEEIKRNYTRGNITSDLKTADGIEYAREIGRMCDYALGREYQKERGGKERGSINRK